MSFDIKYPKTPYAKEDYMVSMVEKRGHYAVNFETRKGLRGTWTWIKARLLSPLNIIKRTYNIERMFEMYKTAQEKVEISEASKLWMLNVIAERDDKTRELAKEILGPKFQEKPCSPETDEGMKKSSAEVADKSQAKYDEAATIIQKHIRGYLARKSFLPSGMFSEYTAQCEKTKSMRQAPGGNTAVFLSEEMPEVVLKQSGRRFAIKRFHQMQEVRSVLTAQKSSHLVIPKARLCGKFLVEERLQININNYHNMFTYILQPQLFDEAVREMTRLFSKVHISDLIGCVTDSLENSDNPEKSCGYVRYDNLPLFITEEDGKKTGKIGLIDLEHASKGSGGLEVLARIFPLHVDSIKDEARKCHMFVDDKALEERSEDGKRYFQLKFADHFDWVKKHGVSTSRPFEIGEKRIKKLKKVVEEELLKLNQRKSDFFKRRKIDLAAFELGFEEPKDFFVDDPQKTAKELSESITPVIIDNIKHCMGRSLDKIKKEKADLSELEQVIYRAFFTDLTLSQHEEVKAIINKDKRVKFADKGISCDDYIVAQQIFDVIVQELVKGNELFSFTRDRGGGVTRLQY